MFVVVQGEVHIEDFMTGVAEVFVLGHTHLPIEIPKQILGLWVMMSSETACRTDDQVWNNLLWYDFETRNVNRETAFTSAATSPHPS